MRAEKNYLIADVETHLKKSEYVILANFTKVTVADVADLRSKLAAEKPSSTLSKTAPFALLPRHSACPSSSPPYPAPRLLWSAVRIPRALRKS